MMPKRCVFSRKVDATIGFKSIRICETQAATLPRLMLHYYTVNGPQCSSHSICTVCFPLAVVLLTIDFYRGKRNAQLVLLFPLVTRQLQARVLLRRYLQDMGGEIKLFSLECSSCDPRSGDLD